MQMDEKDRGKRQVIAVALVTACCLLGDSMLYVVLPIYWREAGLSSLWEVGVLLSVNRLVRIPLGPLIGLWMQRIEGRTALVIAVALASMTTFSYGFQGFWLWLAMRCLWGIAWTILRIGGLSLVVSASTGRNRGEWMGLYNGLYRLGSLGGMLVGAVLVAVYSLGTTSLLFALCALPALVLIYAYIPRSFLSGRPGDAPAAAMRTSIWKKGRVRLTLATGLLLALTYQGVFASTISRLFEERPPVMLMGGIVIGAAVMASVLQGVRWGWEPWAAPWCGRWADRYGKKTIFIGTMAAASCLFALLHVPVSLAIWLGMLVVLQMTATILTTVMDTWAADVAARHSNRTEVMTMYTVMCDGGAALGPLLAYWLDGQFGLPVVYVGMAVILMLLAIVWMRVSESVSLSRDNTF